MQDKNVHTFLTEVVDSIIANDGKIVICGTNELGIVLANRLRDLELEECVVGWYDPIINSPKAKFKGKPILSLKELSSVEISDLVITYDQEKEEILTKLSDTIPQNTKVWLFGHKNYDFNDPLFLEINASLQVKSIAAGYPEMLIHIYQSLVSLEGNKIPGDIVELGTYKGGTAVFMAKVLHALGSTRRIYSFDTFEGFPGKRSSLDMFDEKKYGFVDFDAIKSYCSQHNVELIKGDICKTISSLPCKQVAFSFYDTDNYSATKAALSHIYDITPEGGIFAFDHFFSREWVRTLGERMAAKEFFVDKRAFNLYGTGIFIKISSNE
jgi:O-methyltransferase